MNLLKNDGTTPIKTYEVKINDWPIDRKSNGIGLSINDGWYLGVGFGLALTIAVPVILLLISFVVGIFLVILGAL